jgi:tetratricopeptide (TPR) repeat protein
MDTLETVKQRIDAGDSRGAVHDLIEVLRTDPQNLSAWLLLATLLDDPQKQIDCYRRILRVDPQHYQAQRQLQVLRAALQSSAGAESAPSPGKSIAPPHLEHMGTYDEPHPQADAALLDFEEENSQTLSLEEQQALVEYVVEALGGHVKPRNLIFEVCRRSGMSWQDAEAFVKRVGTEYSHQIAKSKSPLSLFLGIGTILAGIVVVYAGGGALVNSWQYLSKLDDFSFLRSIFRHSSYYFRGFMIIFIGMSMMLGGTAGVVATVRSLKRGDETDP